MLQRRKSTAKPLPPFLNSTKRFDGLGLHPSLDKSGCYKKKITEAGPGTYDVQRHRDCSSKKGVSWKVKLECENFSKYRGYHKPKLLEDAAFSKTLGGPAVHDIKLLRQRCDSIRKNVGLGTQKRFVGAKEAYPPPNTYFRKSKQLSGLLKKDICLIPLFEADNFLDRFKSRAPHYLLPSNIYDITKCDGKNIADITKKVVSAKGPYQTFTGPRDGTTIKNYFAPPSFTPPDYFYIKSTEMDRLLHHRDRANSGKFLKSIRFVKKPTVRHMLNDLSLCYRDPNNPGPPHYKIENYKTISKKPAALYAFNTSKSQARPPPARWSIFPGPGRYTPKTSKCVKLKRPSWVFLSNYQRKIYDEVSYSAF